MLHAKQPAPAFSSANQHNKTINLSDFKDSKHVVLYFYPKDDTPGCTIEANSFSHLVKKFAQHDAVIIGVSKDDCASHQAFIDKFELKVELLADTSGAVCEAYGVWQEKEKNGVKKMGIVRSTFVIAKNGMLIEAIYGVDPNGHAEAMLEVVKAI